MAYPPNIIKAMQEATNHYRWPSQSDTINLQNLNIQESPWHSLSMSEARTPLSKLILPIAETEAKKPITTGRISHRRNCDECVLKKVKCNGQNPCQTCQFKDVNCVHSAKKKPGPSRNAKSSLITKKGQQSKFISKLLGLNKNLESCSSSATAQCSTSVLSTPNSIYSAASFNDSHVANPRNPNVRKNTNAVEPRISDFCNEQAVHNCADASIMVSSQPYLFNADQIDFRSYHNLLSNIPDHHHDAYKIACDAYIKSQNMLSNFRTYPNFYTRGQVRKKEDLIAIHKDRVHEQEELARKQQLELVRTHREFSNQCSQLLADHEEQNSGFNVKGEDIHNDRVCIADKTMSDMVPSLKCENDSFYFRQAKKQKSTLFGSCQILPENRNVILEYNSDLQTRSTVFNPNNLLVHSPQIPITSQTTNGSMMNQFNAVDKNLNAAFQASNNIEISSEDIKSFCDDFLGNDWN